MGGLHSFCKDSANGRNVKPALVFHDIKRPFSLYYAKLAQIKDIV